MADLNNNFYDPAFFERILPILKRNIQGFDEYDFIVRVFDNQWPDLGFESRIRQIANALHLFLGADYQHATWTLCNIADDLLKEEMTGLPYVFLAEYIYMYGVDQPRFSMKAISRVSRIVNCEHGIRPFAPARNEYNARRTDRHMEESVLNLSFTEFV